MVLLMLIVSVRRLHLLTQGRRPHPSLSPAWAKHFKELFKYEFLSGFTYPFQLESDHPLTPLFLSLVIEPPEAFRLL